MLDCPDTYQTSLKNLLAEMSVMIIKEHVNLNKLINHLDVILRSNSTYIDSHH